MSDRFSIAVAAGFCGLVLLASGCENDASSEKDNAPQEQDNTLRQEAPVIAVLTAVKASDLNGFRNAYSKRIREDSKQGDWESNLKEAQKNIKRMYGDYQIEEFTFTFTGDKDKGKVLISHKGQESIALPVIKEDGQWKVDMR